MSKKQAVKAFRNLKDQLPTAFAEQNAQWWSQLHATISKYIGADSEWAKYAQYGTFKPTSPHYKDLQKAGQIVDSCITFISDTGPSAQKKENWLQTFDNRLVNGILAGMFFIGSTVGWLTKDSYYKQQFEGCEKTGTLLTARIDSMASAARRASVPAEEKPAEDKGNDKGKPIN